MPRDYEGNQEKGKEHVPHNRSSKKQKDSRWSGSDRLRGRFNDWIGATVCDALEDEKMVCVSQSGKPPETANSKPCVGKRHGVDLTHPRSV